MFQSETQLNHSEAFDGSLTVLVRANFAKHCEAAPKAQEQS